jgi:hypothetical protein
MNASSSNATTNNDDDDDDDDDQSNTPHTTRGVLTHELLDVCQPLQLHAHHSLHSLQCLCLLRGNRCGVALQQSAGRRAAARPHAVGHQRRR